LDWKYIGPTDVMIGKSLFIDSYVIDDDEAANLTEKVQESTELKLPPILPGRYSRLLKDGQVVQTDMAPANYLCSGFAKGAYGDVLVTGLGLGLMKRMLLSNPRVSSVTFVEIELDLVRFHAIHSGISATHADAWSLPINNPIYDCAFHDIDGELGSDQYRRSMEFLLDVWAHNVSGRHAVWGGESIGLPGGMWKEETDAIE